MSFLPYSGGGTTGWIGAFGASALAHVGLVAGLVTFYNQTLQLAELAQQEQAFDIAVALEQLDSGTLAPNDEVDTPEELPPETAEEVPAEEENVPEVIEETEPEVPEEAETAEVPETPEPDATEEAEVETPEETEPEVAETQDPEIPEDIQPEEVAQTEAETIEEAAPEEALAELEAETVEAGPVESLEAGPIESAALAPESAGAEPVALSPVASDPIGGEEPGGLSPIAPDNSGVQTVTSAAPVSGGLDGGLSVEPVAPLEPVTPVGGGDSGVALAPPTVETIAPPETETVTELAAVAPETGTGPATAVAPAIQQRPPSAQDLALTDLIRRVRQTESDSCLAALPRRDGAEGVGIALIADDETAMESFSAAFVTPQDEGLVQTRALLDDRQCAAVSYIRNTIDYPATRLGLRLDNDLVDSGGSLSGVVRGTPGRYLMLMLIDDNGVVTDLDRFTSTSGDFYRFEVPVNRSGDPRPTKQILLAVAYTQPPDALRERMGLLAQDVFSGLPAPFDEGAEIAVATFDVR